MRKALFFLGTLNDSDIDWMVAVGQKREIRPGSVLIQEGKPIDSMFIVLDGHLSVTVAALSNRKVADLMCGEVVGEMSFIDSHPPSASVKADENSSVLAISKMALSKKLEQDVAFASRFYRAIAVFLSDRLRSTVGLLGYGEGAKLDDDVEYKDELDADVLDSVSLAGARFDWLQRRLRTL
jgi:bacteriocin-type transport-associated protein